jgi:Na+-transporting methylmalonyl-CoA/oxaloacetate decarboxylase gamma subunit
MPWKWWEIAAAVLAYAGMAVVLALLGFLALMIWNAPAP